MPFLDGPSGTTWCVEMDSFVAEVDASSLNTNDEAVANADERMAIAPELDLARALDVHAGDGAVGGKGTR